MISQPERQKRATKGNKRQHARTANLQTWTKISKALISQKVHLPSARHGTLGPQSVDNCRVVVAEGKVHSGLTSVVRLVDGQTTLQEIIGGLDVTVPSGEVQHSVSLVVCDLWDKERKRSKTRLTTLLNACELTKA